MYTDYKKKKDGRAIHNITRHPCHSRLRSDHHRPLYGGSMREGVILESPVLICHTEISERQRDIRKRPSGNITVLLPVS